MKKSKVRHGGFRPGAGGVCRWKHGRTKLVRLPVALLDEILEVARYMDRNEGRLPPSVPPVITLGNPSHTLSSKELKELFAKQKARKLAERVISGDESIWIGDTTFEELPDFPVTQPVDFDGFFEWQDQQRYDSYFGKS